MSAAQSIADACWHARLAADALAELVKLEPVLADRLGDAHSLLRDALRQLERHCAS
jgi:hypothetical protein